MLGGKKHIVQVYILPIWVNVKTALKSAKCCIGEIPLLITLHTPLLLHP